MNYSQCHPLHAGLLVILILLMCSFNRLFSIMSLLGRLFWTCLIPGVWQWMGEVCEVSFDFNVPYYLTLPFGTVHLSTFCFAKKVMQLSVFCLLFYRILYMLKRTIPNTYSRSFPFYMNTFNTFLYCYG